MLSYQHAYHAGNFADVHKHLTLFAVIDHLLRKESAVTYIDTHAGRGLYPLDARETSRLEEYRQGVEPLWCRQREAPAGSLTKDWLAALADAQPERGTLARYPGSPWWLSRRLRPEDRLMLFELHPGEYRHLEGQALANNVQRIQGDGLEGLLRRLPVSTPRLCVLIDPSYERKTEYTEIADSMLACMLKARHAVMLVWYPLLAAGGHHELLEALRDGGLRKIWRSELVHHEPAKGERGMFGSGMLVVNPPWGLSERLAEAMQWICPRLGESSYYMGDWWVGE